MGVTERRQQLGRKTLLRARRGPTSKEGGTGLRTRLGVWLLILLFPLALLLGAAGAAHADGTEEETEKDIDGLSFYRLSSSMTALFSTAQEPGDDVEFAEDGWQTILDSPASAGSMLGYPDENYNPIMGWLDSRVAQSSNSVAYSSLIGSTSSGLDADTVGARDYALYGATLNGLGVDGTSTGLSLGFFGWLGGGLVLILFAISAAVDSLWSMILDTLIWINPFRLIYHAVDSLSGSTFADGMTGGEGASDLPGPLASMAELINQAYWFLLRMSQDILLPIFVGIFFLSIFMFKKMDDKRSALKKLLIRMVFIVLGIPLLGSMYSGVLNVMSDAADEGNSAATQVVLSTYVDFERWALEERLRVPGSDKALIEWDMNKNAPSGESQSSVTNLAFLINAQAMGLQSEDFELKDREESWENNTPTEGEGTFSETHYSEVIDILSRYMDGAHVNASTFESDSKSTLNETTSKNARSWFDEYTKDPEDLYAEEKPFDNLLLAVQSGTGLTTSGSEQLRFSTSGDTQDCGLELSKNNADGSPKACNLAPLAMYNYLNTDFGSSSYTAYSSGKTSSEATRSIHNSVNLVGTGVMSFVYWVNAVVMLGAFVFIGVGYAISLVIANLRRTFQLITAIPFAVVGVVSGIAKVIVYTIAMLMEILVTMFMYKLVQHFLLSIPDFITAPFAQAAVDDKGESTILSFLFNSGFLHMVITLLSITAVILFTVMAMRLRKTLVKAVEDNATKMIEKFTDPKAGSAAGNSMNPGKPGGGGKGMESASGNRAMSGGSGLKNSGGLNAGGTSGGGDGPDGLSTASAGSSETRVSGDVDTDGTLEGPDGSNDGGSGSGLEPSEQEQNAVGETELGRRVENDGLSDDPSEVMAGSIQRSTADYAESDKRRVGAAADGAKATGHAAVAVGRGLAGDEVGAAESAGKAADKGGAAMAGNARANQASERAGKSTLDNPAPSAKHQQQIQKGEQVQQVGKTVSDAAGMAGGTGGGGGSPKGPSKSSRRGPKPPQQPKTPKRK